MNAEKFCTTCNIKIDSNNYLKDRTVCKKCYNKNRRKSNNTLTQTETIISHQQPKIENVINSKNNVNNPGISTYENHAYFVIGPRNVGKTYYMLEILEKIGNKRTIHILTRSPSQYPNQKTSNEIKPKDKYKGSAVIFDGMLGARNSSQTDEFFTRERHEKLDVDDISQSYFGLPRQSIRNNSGGLKLFKQTLRDVESIYKDIGGYDMKYDEFKEMFRRAWSEKINYLCFDMSKNRNEGKYRIFNENKSTYSECICENEPFQLS